MHDNSYRTEDGYFYADSAKLEAAYNERCKAIAIVNPGNPTGCILSKEDMKVKIAELLKDISLILPGEDGYVDHG
jgi:aspartate aminotransferase